MRWATSILGGTQTDPFQQQLLPHDQHSSCVVSAASAWSAQGQSLTCSGLPTAASGGSSSAAMEPYLQSLFVAACLQQLTLNPHLQPWSLL
eukprot:1157696-Pelagomonas_calceolata.AAC.4